MAVDADKIKILCIGGGTGISGLLSGLKLHEIFDISAVVTTFDSGGSSGELRDRYGILPPGDVARCVCALAKDEKHVRTLFLSRVQGIGHAAHSAANLLMMSLERELGNAQRAADALAQIVSARGRVLPVSLRNSSLCAVFKNRQQACGEIGVDEAIREGRDVEKLFLKPHVKANPEAVNAIKNADVICIGPGSLYTSICVNFLPRGITAAIAESSAPIIFVMNLMTEGRGMIGYTVGSVTSLVEKIIFKKSKNNRKLDRIIINNRWPEPMPVGYMQEYKFIIPCDDVRGYARYVFAPLWMQSDIARHDSTALANVIREQVKQLLNIQNA